MRLENDIQEWLAQMAGRDSISGSGDLYSVVRYDDSDLGQEMKNEVEGYGIRGGLARSRHRAVREACRVLRSFKEPRFKSANKNVSPDRSKVLRPDLIFEDEISSALVIVEIKRSRQTAREFATELLAYTNCLKARDPDSQIFLVLISTSLAPLEQHAFAQLTDWHIPVLALEYQEKSWSEQTPTLLVRSDLLPAQSDNKFLPGALRVETKVFYLPYRWQRTNWMNKVEHAALGLVREAEKGWASGFVIMWWQAFETPDRSQGRPEVRLFVSMAVRNPSRPQELPKFKNEEDELDFAFSNTYTETVDDTATRLLSNFELGAQVQAFSPEYEGTWDDLASRLCNDDALILRFDGFGEIGTRVSNWRTEKRYSMAPLIEDVTDLPVWHPLTWLPALETLIDRSAQNDTDSIAWDAFRRGKDLAGMENFRFRRASSRHFGWSVAQSDFSTTWCRLVVQREDAPKLFLRASCDALRYYETHTETAFGFGSQCAAEESELAKYCFELGFQYGLEAHTDGYFERRCAELRKKGIRIPQALQKVLKYQERCRRS